jgi:hypothetical protein
MSKYTEGMKVRAQVIITEGGDDIQPDFEATFDSRNPGYVHAAPGDLGTVEYVDDDDVPTVRFDKKGTATIVGDHEIEIVKN